MSFLGHLILSGIVGAGAVILIKVQRCPCYWVKVPVVFIGGAFGAWIYRLLAHVGKLPLDFLASQVVAIAMAAVFYCIVCPIGPKEDREPPNR